MTDDALLRKVLNAIASGDDQTVSGLLDNCPDIARWGLAKGATRAETYFLADIGLTVYAGDTALHVAAAAYQSGLVQKLIGMGADIRARNRRGAEPLHSATVGAPGERHWNPAAQAATIACLIKAGANPDAIDKAGVTPLHRAIRNRCAAAVRALLEAGAAPTRRNGNGSTAMQLATQTTGRGGTGSPEAKAQQVEIIRLLEGYS